MGNYKFGRRDLIKYGLISSLFILSGCSVSNKKLVLRGDENTFPREFIDNLSTPWEFIPIKKIESGIFSYKTIFQEKTDLLVLNDGWIFDLPYDKLKEIKANQIRENLSNKANSFLDGLGEDYKNRILPLAASPWVILFRNEDSLALQNKNSWEVIFSSALKDQVVFPSSAYLLISIAKKIGLYNDFAKIKKQAKSFDDRNALNWVVSGRAHAAVLPFSYCVDSLVKDPRLSVLLPNEGSPLNWTVIASPSISSEPFLSDWFKLLWGPIYSRRLIRKGFLPPNDFSQFRRKNFNISQRYQSVFLPEKIVWDKCWSLPKLDFEAQREMAFKWNNS